MVISLNDSRGQNILNETTNTHSPQSNPHYIAIIGGRKTGKTTLCASLHQSLIAKAHGYSPNLIARFPDAEGLQQLQNLFAQKFNAPQSTFRADPAGPVREIRIAIDFGTSKWSLFKRPDHEITGCFEIAIDDLRDDFDLLGQFVATQSHKAPLAAVNSSNISSQQSQESPLEKFENSLNKARSLIICQPALQKLAPSETTGFIRLMSDIATGYYGKFDNIIIAFTKYERIFIKSGVKAFMEATKPDTILQTMATTINQDHAFETGLRALMSNSSSNDTPHLYGVPVSSFGFLRENGAPNYDILSDQPISALAPLIESPRSENPLPNAMAKTKVAGITVPVTEDNPLNATSIPHPSTHWLPFLSADPFLTAISGQPSQFMIPLSNFISTLDHGINPTEVRKKEYKYSA